VLFFVVFAYLECIEYSKLSSNLYAIIIAIVMVLFAGLRDHVGTDWIAYKEAYFFKNWEVEIGYSSLNDMFSAANLPYNIFLLFLNLISIFLYYSTLKKYVPFFVISLLIFFSDYYMYYNLSGIRQAVAISFVVYSIRFLSDKSFVKFLFVILIASMFHVTSFIFIGAYFIPFRRANRREIFLALTFFFSISFLIFAILELVSGDLAYKAKFYLEVQENAPNLKHLFLVGAVKRAIILIMVWFFGKKLWENRVSFFFLNTYLIGFGLYLSTYLLSPDIGVRFSSYFIIFEIFLAGQLLMVNSKLTTRLLITSVFCIVSFYKVYTYSVLDTYQYHFILSL